MSEPRTKRHNERLAEALIAKDNRIEELEKRVECTQCGARFESCVDFTQHVRKEQDHPSTVAALIHPPRKQRSKRVRASKPKGAA